MPKDDDANVFVLQPCRVRAGWFVPTKDEPLTFNWKELRAKFAPQGARNAILCLRQMHIGGFVGLVQTPKGPAAFFYSSADRSGKISKAVVKDDQWADRVVEVYRVEKAQWATRVTEH